jgi:8-hydroxy-5-deazaflavin:NADPH oxidoreductase
MSYAIIGAGAVGQALAKMFARKQISTAIASRRSPEALTPIATAIGPTIIQQSLQNAVKADKLGKLAEGGLLVTGPG